MNFCNTKLAGLGEIFYPSKIFSATLYIHTVDREFFIVKNFSSTTFPTKIKHVKYFV